MYSRWGGTRGSETSQYPLEQKTSVIPLVVASERGGWLNRAHVIPGGGCGCGVVGRFFSGPPARAGVINRCVSRSGLGWSVVEGENPVGENSAAPVKRSRVAAGPWNLL